MKLQVAGALCALSMLAPAAASAADPAVMAPITQFMAAFNKGDIKAAEATHTADVVILDEPPPFVWKGPGAFQAWLGDLDRDGKAQGQSEQSVSISAPVREEISATLRKTADGWKISAWTWTGPRATPVKAK